jgi:hypothetical protein
MRLGLKGIVGRAASRKTGLDTFRFWLAMGLAPLTNSLVNLLLAIVHLLDGGNHSHSHFEKFVREVWVFELKDSFIETAIPLWVACLLLNTFNKLYALQLVATSIALGATVSLPGVIRGAYADPAPLSYALTDVLQTTWACLWTAVVFAVIGGIPPRHRPASGGASALTSD